MQADTLIRIKDLNFSYDERAILKGINMEIPRGKLIAIMGNSGCGKTTLLRLIGGQLKPTSGTLLVDGESVPDMSHDELYAMRRKMGMLFQFGALFTDISVFDNVAYLMREHDPMLIMYDEPFAGLDPISMGVIGQLVRKLGDALGATSLLVTHDVQEALLIVDYVYFVSDGQIVAQGTADEIRASTDPFVHQFVQGEADGPVHFHYPAQPFASELLRENARA